MYCIVLDDQLKHLVGSCVKVLEHDIWWMKSAMEYLAVDILTIHRVV